MANEYGEEIAIYVWPTDHEDGQPYPDDFHERIASALSSIGVSWEVC